MKRLSLFLCEWNCNLKDADRPRDLPCFDPDVCTCGAAAKNKLIRDTRRAASDVSFHNAAEGDAWQREREQSRKAQDQFNELRQICAEAGIDWRQGESYLI